MEKKALESVEKLKELQIIRKLYSTSYSFNAYYKLIFHKIYKECYETGYLSEVFSVGEKVQIVIYDKLLDKCINTFQIVTIEEIHNQFIYLMDETEIGWKHYIKFNKRIKLPFQ